MWGACIPRSVASSTTAPDMQRVLERLAGLRGPGASRSCGHRPGDAALRGADRCRPASRCRGLAAICGHLLHHRAQHVDHRGRLAKLAERRARERRDRVERRVAEELEPDLGAKAPRRSGTSDQPALNDLGDALAALARGAVGLADREAGSLDVADHAGLDDLGGRVDHRADGAPVCRGLFRITPPGSTLSSCRPSSSPP